MQSSYNKAYHSLLYPSMTRQDCILCITHCSGCAGHVTLRHKQDQYYSKALQVLQWLGEDSISYRPAVRLGLLLIPRDSNVSSGDIDTGRGRGMEEEEESIKLTFSDRLQRFQNTTNGHKSGGYINNNMHHASSRGTAGGLEDVYPTCTCLGCFEVQAKCVFLYLSMYSISLFYLSSVFMYLCFVSLTHTHSSLSSLLLLATLTKTESSTVSVFSASCVKDAGLGGLSSGGG